MLAEGEQQLVPGDDEIGLGGKRGTDDHIVIRIGRDARRGSIPSRRCGAEDPQTYLPSRLTLTPLMRALSLVPVLPTPGPICAAYQ